PRPLLHPFPLHDALPIWASRFPRVASGRPLITTPATTASKPIKANVPWTSVISRLPPVPPLRLGGQQVPGRQQFQHPGRGQAEQDRKSTRLNSSHVKNSY